MIFGVEGENSYGIAIRTVVLLPPLPQVIEKIGLVIFISD